LSKSSPASLNLGELPNLDIGEPASDSSKNILFFWKVFVVDVCRIETQDDWLVIEL